MSASAIFELQQLIEQLREQLIEAEAKLATTRSSGGSLIRLDEAHLVLGSAREDFSTEILGENGWRPAHLDLIKPNPYVAILESESPRPGRKEFLVLCPSISATPLHIDVARCAVIDRL